MRCDGMPLKRTSRGLGRRLPGIYVVLGHAFLCLDEKEGPWGKGAIWRRCHPRDTYPSRCNNYDGDEEVFNAHSKLWGNAMDEGNWFSSSYSGFD